MVVEDRRYQGGSRLMPAEQRGSQDGVTLDAAPLLGRERTGLLPDRIEHTHPAQVVEGKRLPQRL